MTANEAKFFILDTTTLPRPAGTLAGSVSILNVYVATVAKAFAIECFSKIRTMLMSGELDEFCETVCFIKEESQCESIYSRVVQGHRMVGRYEEEHKHLNTAETK